MEQSWTEWYIDALEFFYWEPQHLGRKRHADAKLDSAAKVREHLRIMEITLNHNFSHFFSLAPLEFRRQFFQRIFGRSFVEDYRMSGHTLIGAYGLAPCPQPDVFFTSPRQVVSLEMKIGSRSSIDQVIKYALLGLADEMHSGMEKEHYLAFLAPGAFASLWKNGWSNAAQLSSVLAHADLNSYLAKQPKKFHTQTERFKRIIETMTLGHITYPDVTAFLHGIKPPTGTGDCAEVYRKLIDGLIGELDRRKLAGGNSVQRAQPDTQTVALHCLLALD